MPRVATTAESEKCVRQASSPANLRQMSPVDVSISKVVATYYIGAAKTAVVVRPDRPLHLRLVTLRSAASLVILRSGATKDLRV
jgi:hypothetical protein